MFPLKKRFLLQATIFFASLTFVNFLICKSYVNFKLDKNVLRYPSDKRSLILSMGNGRLGNQMSTLSTLLAFEDKFNLLAYVTGEQATLLSYYFKMDTLWPHLRVMEMHYPNYQSYAWISYPFPQRKNSHVHYYWFDYSNEILWYQLQIGYMVLLGPFDNEIQHYRRILPKLRHMFQFKDEIQHSAFKTLGRFRLEYLKSNPGVSDDDITYISIHMRCREYADHLKMFYGSEPFSEEFYLKAIDFYRNKYKNPLFYVVSDDPKKAKENLLKTSDASQLKDVYVLKHDEALSDWYNIFKSDLSIGHDLALLSMANHSILSYGTFGMWGALLAGGEAVMSTKILDTKEGQEIKEGNLTGWTMI